MKALETSATSLLLRPYDSSTDEPAAVGLYEAAFPPDERRPVRDWLRLLRPGSRMQGLVLEADGCFAGFITLWDFGQFAYAEHFAVCPEQRGHGLGAIALGRVLEQPGRRPLVLEVEPPDTGPQAKRRIGFYRRCGLTLCSRPYQQPPYAPGLSPLPLRLMCSHPRFLGRHFDTVRTLIRRHVYGIPG